MLMEIIFKLNSSNIDDIAIAYSCLNKCWTILLQQPGFSEFICTDASMKEFYSRIKSPPDQALGVICSNYKSTIRSEHERQNGYLELARFVDR